MPKHVFNLSLPFVFKGKSLKIDFPVESESVFEELTPSHVRNSLFRHMARVNDMELTEDLITFQGIMDIWLPPDKVRELIVHRVEMLIEIESLMESISQVELTNLDDAMGNNIPITGEEKWKTKRGLY